MEESRQTDIPAVEAQLWQGARRLKEEAVLADAAAAVDRRALHLVLRRRPAVHAGCPLLADCSGCEPASGDKAVSPVGGLQLLLQLSEAAAAVCLLAAGGADGSAADDDALACDAEGEGGKEAEVKLASGVGDHIQPPGDAAVELVDSYDVRSPTRIVSWDADRRQLVVEVLTALQPNADFTLYVWGNRVYDAAGLRMDDAALAFHTAALPSIRIVVSPAAAGGGAAKLVTLSRSLGLMAELLAAITARFHLPARTVGRVWHVTAGRQLIASDSDVAQLLDGARLQFEQLSEARAAVSVRAGVPELSFAEYCRQHWVNAEAGFYAVVGKMEAEEETAALLAVVRACADAADLASWHASEGAAL